MAATIEPSIHDLCKEQHLADLPRILADNPKDLHLLNEKGETPLFSAAREGSLAVVNYLVKCGADIKHQNTDGQTILHTSAQFGHLSLVHYLVLKGFAVDATDIKETSTPLHWAVVNNHSDVVRYLLNCGANPLLKTRRGVNAIHLAAGLGHTSTLFALLDKCNNTDWRAEDTQGRSPVEVAKQNKHIPIANYLRAYRKIVSSYDWLGWALLPPYVLIMMALAPFYPWFSLTAMLVLGAFCLTPWRPYLFSPDKTYYLFLGLVYFSIVLNIKQSGDYLGPSLEYGLYAVLTSLATIFYSFAIFIGPGIHKVAKNKDDQEFMKQVNEGETDMKVCHTCLVRRPARAKHCHQVGGCVLRFDHFCVWVGNAVGAGNHAYFMLFLFFIIPMQLFCAVIHVQAIRQFIAGMTWTDAVVEMVLVHPTVTFIALFAIIGLWQIPLLLGQMHGIFVGLTAYEKMVMRRKFVEKEKQCRSDEHGHTTCPKLEYDNGLTLAQNVNEFMFQRFVINYNHKPIKI